MEAHCRKIRDICRKRPADFGFVQSPISPYRKAVKQVEIHHDNVTYDRECQDAVQNPSHRPHVYCNHLIIEVNESEFDAPQAAIVHRSGDVKQLKDNREFRLIRYGCHGLRYTMLGKADAGAPYSQTPVGGV